MGWSTRTATSPRPPCALRRRRLVPPLPPTNLPPKTTSSLSLLLLCLAFVVVAAVVVASPHLPTHLARSGPKLVRPSSNSYLSSIATSAPPPPPPSTTTLPPRRLRKLLSIGATRSLRSSSPPPPPPMSAQGAAAKDDASSAVRRKITFGGSRKINQKTSDDLLAAAEVDAGVIAAPSDVGGGGGGVGLDTAQEDEESALRRMRTTMERNHMRSSFVAGIGSGVLASIVCAPLDLIRTRMQVMGELKSAAAGAGGASSSGGRSAAAAAEAAAAMASGRMPSLSIFAALRDIFKQDGVTGCFRGLGATLATVPLFWGIYFPLYERTKRELHHAYCSGGRGDGHGATAASGSACPAVVHMGSAVLAGAVADTVCNPMFLVRTRMQTEALHYFEQPPSERVPHGVWRTVRNLYAEGGMPVFWRGLTASLMGLSHVAIQFPVYEFLKAEARADSPTGEETAADLLLASGVAKMCASFLTYPHEVIRSRMMDARGAYAGQNVIRTARRIVRYEGFASLYTGLHVSLLRVVPNCCITFMSYELILRWAKENAAR